MKPSKVAKDLASEYLAMYEENDVLKRIEVSKNLAIKYGKEEGESLLATMFEWFKTH